MWSRVGTTSGFYVDGRGVPPLANGMATAADWMSAASFLSMAGLVSFMGYTGTIYLMGWTGGYVLLALLLAPSLRKYGRFTVPEFVGDRYYSQTARLVAVFCAIFISFTYVAGQMRGVGVVFSRFLEVDVTVGVVIGVAIVFFYAVVGGMRGITYTQVAQYCVLIVAYIVPAAAISSASLRTVSAGICNSDLHFQTGDYFYPMPAVLGHESAGVVEQVGPDVRHVVPGDHVITCLSVFCGHCEYCLSGRPSLCQRDGVRRAPEDGPRLQKGDEAIHQFLELSSYAEQMLVHENAIVKVTKDMPLDRAALIGCGVTTGVGAVFNTARITAGSIVAVVGCGGVGLNCVQGAALAGAGRVIAVDVLDSKLEMARKFGATGVVSAGDGNAVANIREMTGER